MPRPSDLPAFQQFQFAFAAHIRNPKQHPLPTGVSKRGMAVYKELLFNNLEGFLLACFPVLRQVLGKRKWTKLVRDFFSVHRCQTPFFRQIPDEFIAYLQNERGNQPEDLPFMMDLAHYEWIELALSVSNKEIQHDLINAQGDLLACRPAFNPVLWLQQYAYPVHKIGPRFKPTIEQQAITYLLVFRNAKDQMRFLVLNPIAARLISLLQTEMLTGREALSQIASELAHPQPEVVFDGGRAILDNLKQIQAVVGTWKNPA